MTIDDRILVYPLPGPPDNELEAELHAVCQGCKRTWNLSAVPEPGALSLRDIKAVTRHVCRGKTPKITE